jgi:hypothetical protein
MQDLPCRKVHNNKPQEDDWTKTNSMNIKNTKQTKAIE